MNKPNASAEERYFGVKSWAPGELYLAKSRRVEDVAEFTIPGEHEWTAGELIYMVMKRAARHRWPQRDLGPDWYKLDPLEKQCWEEAAYMLLTEKEKVTSPLM